MTSQIRRLARVPASPRRECLATDTISDSAAQVAPSLRMVNAAATEIYQRWLPHVGEAAARAEADNFARRFHILIDAPPAPLTVTELDAVLAGLADAMAAP